MATMIDPSWPRWIWASFTKYFADGLNGKIQLYVEGDDHLISQKIPDNCELRIDGPHCRTLLPNDWEIDVIVNILVNSISDEADTHKIHRNNGLIANLFTGVISVYRYGDGIGDNNSLVGCFYLKDPERDVTVTNLGFIQTDVKIQQSTIEASFKGYFTGI